MSTMTSDNDGEEQAEQYPGLLPGRRVADLEDDGKHLRVVARTPHTAATAHIAAVGASVAELNPEYPEDDPVYLGVYESDLDERFGARWQNWSGAYLAFHTGNHGLRTYSFPASRLEKAEERDPEKWEKAAEDDGGEGQ